MLATPGTIRVETLSGEPGYLTLSWRVRNSPALHYLKLHTTDARTLWEELGLLLGAKKGEGDVAPRV